MGLALFVYILFSLGRSVAKTDTAAKTNTSSNIDAPPKTGTKQKNDSSPKTDASSPPKATQRPAPKPKPRAGDWQNDLPAFAKKLAAALKTGTHITVADTQNSFRGYQALTNAKGDMFWILDTGGLPDTCQTKIDEAFGGKTVTWEATVEDVDDGENQVLVFFKTDPAVKTIIEDLTIRADVPKPTTLKLKPNQKVTVRAVIPATNHDELFNGIRVMVGAGPNRGKRRVIIGLQKPEFL